MNTLGRISVGDKEGVSLVTKFLCGLRYAIGNHFGIIKPLDSCDLGKCFVWRVPFSFICRCMWGAALCLSALYFVIGVLIVTLVHKINLTVHC